MAGRAPPWRPGRDRRVPRGLHPIAWWLWATGLAIAVTRTTNPMLLALVLAVLAFVVANRRGEAPWSRAFKYYLGLALAVVSIRVVFRVVFGGDIDAATMHVWFRLPRVPLPHWAAGVQLGGPVTAEETLSALYDGLMLGALLCCVGAANALANPKRALRVLPGALYELGVAVVVSISVAPQLVESGQRVRRARKLRGSTRVGVHALREIVVPVLEDALERSLRLAAAMDCRGYGRTGPASRRSRRATGALMLTGMAGLCTGAYGVLDPSLPWVLGGPALIIGCALCVTGLAVGGRRIKRTRYRPDPWLFPEWAVALSGVVPAVVFVSGAGLPAGVLNPSTFPLTWPSVPILPVVALLVAALAAFVAPPPPPMATAEPGPAPRREENPDAPAPGPSRPLELQP